MKCESDYKKFNLIHPEELTKRWLSPPAPCKLYFINLYRFFFSNVFLPVPLFQRFNFQNVIPNEH